MTGDLSCPRPVAHSHSSITELAKSHASRSDKSSGSKSKPDSKSKSKGKAKSDSKKSDLKAKADKKSGKGKSKTKWYAEGLAFECTQCGECCSGEPGYVFVDDAEIVQLQAAMKMDAEEFASKFLRRVGNQISLVEYPDGDCIFLEPKTRRCMVYEARPIQCRTWPFWDSNLATKKDWKETCEVCPGAGKGKLVPLAEIEIRRKEKSV